MKLLVVCLLAGVAAAAVPPQARSQLPPAAPQPNRAVEIVRSENDNIGVGNYKYGYEQSDGTKVAAQGELKNEGREDAYVAVKGSFEWVAADGQKYVVTYTADENGYRPHYGQDPTTLDRNGYVDPAVLTRLLTG